MRPAVFWSTGAGARIEIIWRPAGPENTAPTPVTIRKTLSATAPGPEDVGCRPSDLQRADERTPFGSRTMGISDSPSDKAGGGAPLGNNVSIEAVGLPLKCASSRAASKSSVGVQNPETSASTCSRAEQ